MDPLHCQAILDCYDDIARDMNPGLVLRYSTVNWRDGDPGFIRAKAKNDGPFAGTKALLDKLLDLPYDGFEDFVKSLKEVPYAHLVRQLLESQARLQAEVEKGTIKKKNLGKRPWEVRRRTMNRIGALSIVLTSLMICVWVVMVPYGARTHEAPLLTVFPRRLKTFVGREDVFERIDACLQENQTCLIKGLGGVGKTSLAIEYGHRRAERYPGGVFWVSTSRQLDKLDTKKMVSVLERFSLASPCHAFKPCAFSVNRIVQEVVVAKMNESLRINHLENALMYSTYVPSHRNISRVKAEFLMAHIHYAALNVAQYQTLVPIASSSAFFNKSTEFLCQWGACEEAYFFLHAQMMLFFRPGSIQNLCCRLLDHVSFLDNTLLPCLFDGNVPVALLVDIADNLSWEQATCIAEAEDQNTAKDSCDFDHIAASLENTASSIYKRLIQSRKLDHVNYSDMPFSFYSNTVTYISEETFENLENLLKPNPARNAMQKEYWRGLGRMVNIVGRFLHPQFQNRMRFDGATYFDASYFKKLLHHLQQCKDVKCLDSSEDLQLRSMRCCLLIHESRELLQNYWSNIQKATKVVRKLLLMHYRYMETSSCTNTYFDAMLGLPRESKEFDIVEFARNDWHDLLGDLGVLKSVLSLSSLKFVNNYKNQHEESMRALAHRAIYVDSPLSKTAGSAEFPFTTFIQSITQTGFIKVNVAFSVVQAQMSTVYKHGEQQGNHYSLVQACYK
uniref:Uncharacterized protein n=1 Tax=Branchiostoma floridae TaxID=7739 RepID=C3ZRT4_BRAFL|eukprot:XP_002588723.1 hypothetical protein BRAFLDRAFT_100220 [Branchiostoma floridae]